MVQSVNSINSYNAVNSLASNHKTQSFKGSKADVSDSFERTAPKQIDVKTKFGFSKDTISGSVDGKEFNIKQGASLKRMLNLNGTFDGKPVHVEGRYRTFKPVKITGHIGDKAVDLTFKQGFFKDTLKGVFDGKEINIKLKSGWNSRKIEGSGVDMRFKHKSMFSKKGDFKGKFEASPELLPLLLAIINKKEQDEAAMIILCC